MARLFRFFLENPRQVPARDGDDPIHRIVCDYIAGMTDGYFRRVYAAVSRGLILLRRKDQTLSGAGEGCFRGLFYEVSLALVGVASPA